MALLCHSRLPLVQLVFLLALFSMKVNSLVLPTFLLSQFTVAVPTWEHHDVSNNTLLDPEGNKLGAVASEDKICSDIGGAILKQGGNAADATVSSTPYLLNSILMSLVGCHSPLCGRDWHAPLWDWWWRLHACSSSEWQL